MGGWLVGHHGATAAMGGEREAGSDTEAATRAPLPAPGPSSDPAAGPMEGGFEHMDPWMAFKYFLARSRGYLVEFVDFETLTRKRQYKLARVKSETLQL